MNRNYNVTTLILSGLLLLAGCNIPSRNKSGSSKERNVITKADEKATETANLQFAELFNKSEPERIAPFATNEDSTRQWDHIIEKLNTTETITLTDSSHNNTLIRNCIIHDTGKGKDGIFLRDVKNIRIENCEIYNIDGPGGIRMSNTGSGTYNVQIIANTIYDVQNNGIVAPQRSQNSPALNQTNLEISDNTIYNTGLGSARGLNHSIYCQAADHLIKRNQIFGTRDGNGISVRSSGVVSDNIVSGRSRANKSGIRYFSDHMKGNSNTLLIEYNTVSNDSTDTNTIDIFDLAKLYKNSNGDRHVVKNFNIRYNTVISSHPNRYAVYISDHYNNNSYNIQVYGNRATNLKSAANVMFLPDIAQKAGNQ